MCLSAGLDSATLRTPGSIPLIRPVISDDSSRPDDFILTKTALAGNDL